MTHEEFMRIVRETNEWERHPERWTEAERLRERIMSNGKTNAEWIELEKEVRIFFQSDASEEDKQMLSGYTECLHMFCNAIRENRM